MYQFAFLDCEDAAKWHGHAEAFQQLFPGLDIQWDVVRCYEDGALPPIAELSRYDALALSGSHHSAADDTPWIRRLAAWLADAVQNGPPRLRIVGLCFGSQILARALGGTVGKNPSGRFVLKVEDLRFEEALQRDGSFRAALPTTLASGDGCRVLESHGDQVLQLPPGAVRLASSPTADNDMWGAGGGRVLAIQGHPEMSCATAADKILPAVSSRMTEEEVAASRASLEAGGTDDAAIMRFIAAFMTAGRSGGGSDSASASNVHGNTADSASATAAAAAPPVAATAGSDHAPHKLPSAAAAESQITGSHGAAQQHGFGRDSSSAAAAGRSPEIAVVTDLLHRLPTESAVPQQATGPQPASTALMADAIASGQFDWATGFPSSAAAPPQSSAAAAAAPAAAVTSQQNGHSGAQQMPAGGSSAAAEAILSGHFQWGGGGSSVQPQPLQHATLEPQDDDDPVASAFGDMDRQLDSLSAALDLLDQRSEDLAAKVKAQRTELQPHLPA